MLIALLVVLGVDLVVVLAIALLVIGHARLLKRQPGEFDGAIRVTSGEVEGLRSTWTRGSGRWIGDVVVWNGAPLRLRSTVVGIDEIAGEHDAHPTEVKRLGKHPVVVELVTGSSVIDVAADAGDRDRLTGRAEV